MRPFVIFLFFFMLYLCELANLSRTFQEDDSPWFKTALAVPIQDKMMQMPSVLIACHAHHTTIAIHGYVVDHEAGQQPSTCWGRAKQNLDPPLFSLQTPTTKFTAAGASGLSAARAGRRCT